MIRMMQPLLAAAVLALGLAPAQAQLARTFVSSLGSDGNDCNRLTPCRTFQVAHDKTLASGEITVLDAGGYGSVTITKEISIVNDGVGEAGMLVSGGLNGVTVNAAAGDAISLRGLTIKGIGFGGGNGIVFNSGRSLIVENCAIRTLDGSALGFGLRFQPSAASRLAVVNTIVVDNTGTGIAIFPNITGNQRVTLSHVQLINNGSGLDAIAGFGASSATVDAVVEDSLVIANNVFGLRVSDNAVLGNVPGNLLVTRSIIAHGNGTALTAAGTQATLRIGQSGITANRVTFAQTDGGVVRSYGDNNINGNADGDPAPPVIAKK